tara:strand:+ start:685 stop:1320 length:636 start_codon:yes stop_codon:yes gene_type:complete
MSTILQDMMGMLSRKEEVTPVITDYITIARTGNGRQNLTPFPKTNTRLVTIAKLATLFDANDTFLSAAAFAQDTQVLTLTRNDAAAIAVDLSVGPVYLKDDSRIDGSTVLSMVDGNSESVQAFTGSIVLCDYSGDVGNATVVLPSAAMTSPVLWVNRRMTFVCDATIDSTHTFTIDPDGSETIAGAATFVLDSANEFVTIWSDGVNWRVLS